MISIAIGIVSSHTKRFQSYVDVLTTSRDFRYMAKLSPGSNWAGDHMPQQPKLRPETPTRSRILVVEPDGAMAMLLQEILSLEGYSVDVTNSADDALHLARDMQPDLILLESNLSDRRMDGWGLCRVVKEDKDLSSIWVVMVTSHPDQSAALEAGADLYLPKPFDMPSLLSEVSSLLRSRQRLA